MKTALVTLLLYSMLAPYQPGSKRKVLLFAADRNNPVLIQQQKALAADSMGLQERDVEIQTYLLNEKSRGTFTTFKTLDQPFTFILVGKDGGEKLRSHSVVANRKLFGLIDEMPMRKREKGLNHD